MRTPLVLLVVVVAMVYGAPYPADITVMTPAKFPVASFTMPNETWGNGATYFGAAANGVGDLNDDGLEDFAFTAYGATPPNTNLSVAGAVFIIWGKLGWSDPAVWPSISSLPNLTLGVVIYGATAGQYVGWNVNGECDVNGDNIDDLFIGGFASSVSTAALYVVFGRRSGWTSVISLGDLNGTNGFQVSPDSTTGLTEAGWSSYFGYGDTKCAGDFNGDQFMDIILSDHLADAFKGRAILIYGRASWPSHYIISTNTTSSFDGTVFTDSLALSSSDQQHFLGYGLGRVDLNLDGHVDLLISAPYVNSLSGMVNIIWGSAGATRLGRQMALPVTSASKGCYFTTSESGAFTGWAITSGDFNGDSEEDAIITSLGSAKVTVIFATKSTAMWGTGALDVTKLVKTVQLDDQIPSEIIGYTVLSGDINGDSYSDVLVGAPFALEKTGRVYIWFGSQSPSNLTLTNTTVPDGSIWSRVNGQDPEGYFGFSVGVLCKNGDVAVDLIVGAPAANGFLGMGYMISRSYCKVSANSSSNFCTACYVGYGLNKTAGTCTACVSGSTYSDGTDVCKSTATSTECLVYSQTGFCTRCSNGTGLMFGECMAACTGNTWSYGTTACLVGGIARCKKTQSSTSAVCTACEPGYSLTKSTSSAAGLACVACTGNTWSSTGVDCVAGMANCGLANRTTGECIICSNGYYIHETTGDCLSTLKTHSVTTLIVLFAIGMCIGLAILAAPLAILLISMVRQGRSFHKLSTNDGIAMM